MSIELNTQALKTARDLQEQYKTQSASATEVIQNIENKVKDVESEGTDLISDTARALQSLFSKISMAAEVDENKVAAAKTKLANGEIGLLSSSTREIQKSAQSIAEKMVQFESRTIKES